MTNYRIQHCPKIGASYEELGGMSASELREWQNETLQGQVADEDFALLATWSFHPMNFSYLGNNKVAINLPVIGASWNELGRESVSETRQFWNTYLMEQLAREELSRNSNQALAFVREPFQPTPIKLNPLLDRIDEANKERVKQVKKREELN